MCDMALSFIGTTNPQIGYKLELGTNIYAAAGNKVTPNPEQAEVYGSQAISAVANSLSIWKVRLAYVTSVYDDEYVVAWDEILSGQNGSTIRRFLAKDEKSWGSYKVVDPKTFGSKGEAEEYINRQQNLCLAPGPLN
jgi:hypothetical protein